MRFCGVCNVEVLVGGSGRSVADVVIRRRLVLLRLSVFLSSLEFLRNFSIDSFQLHCSRGWFSFMSKNSARDYVLQFIFLHSIGDPFRYHHLIVIEWSYIFRIFKRSVCWRQGVIGTCCLAMVGFVGLCVWLCGCAIFSCFARSRDWACYDCGL